MNSQHEKLELSALAKILKEIISKIEEKASVENLGVLIKDAFIHCQNKPLFKAVLNNYMMDSFQSSKPKINIFKKKNNLLDTKVIEYILSIDCEEKPLIEIENAFGNIFHTGGSNITLPSPTLIKRFFHLIESNKEKLLTEQIEIDEKLKGQLEVEKSILSTCFGKFFQTITKVEEILSNFKSFCVFINEIGVHAKYFVETSLKENFDQYVIFFFFLLYLTI